MSTHNICFCGEIRKIFTCYPLLSIPMNSVVNRFIYIGEDQVLFSTTVIILIYAPWELKFIIAKMTVLSKNLGPKQDISMV